jgi:hypothetical protein
MSKISYASLEEAWGDSFAKTEDKTQDKSKEKNNNNETLSNRDKYEYLNKTSEEDRKIVINNMNTVERHKTPINNITSEIEKYRFNSDNKVEKNDSAQSYTPFNENIEKKYLQDKLNYLENEFKKYKMNFDKIQYSNKDYVVNQQLGGSVENFSNQADNSGQGNSTNDIFDIMMLIIIGLIIIFVMNSIFNIGKSIGARMKVV